MRHYLTILFLLTGLSTFCQLKSPDEFLGYKLGSRYTPHHNIVNYFREAAAAMPAMMKLEQYGTTNEGRPLLLAYIASPENLQRLETIRQQNLALAGMGNGKPADNNPVIVWLSYNVHGNETSSSEAAMLTLYELLNPKNAQSREWLKNMVVILDPCINPDGRDRYVNWYNSVVGRQSDPKPFTREHREPWPGGRPNHYYFDLNRDWAWQTQVETQQRLVKYNSWLPQVHVDFHEQSYNEPYYFAPAAEPFHEVITSWQREFQTIIGKNNAKYFDQNGWLYFTKERFDLFYPSYGDTYPTYKGAIGMTFEQGGGGRSGSAVIIEDGDTLTLWDRLYHHFTTGMSTLEVTATHAAKVLKEYREYYRKAVNEPAGEFKAYLVRAGQGDQVKRLTAMLDRNAIEWSYVAARNLTGLNYRSGKTETFRSEGKDIVVNANQPNSNLLRVLFERNSRLSDSLTYDITAWSIPYVYGLNTYGLSNYLPDRIKTLSDSSTPPARLANNAYAYAIEWKGLSSARFLSELVRQGVKVRYAQEPFQIHGHNYAPGSLLVTRAANAQVGDRLESVIQAASQKVDLNFTPIASGFVDKGFDLGSGRVRYIRAPRVGLLSGDQVSSLGMGEIWHFFDTQLEYPVNVIRAEDVNAAVLSNLDVLIMPDGNYKLLSEKAGYDMLRNWVNGGGKLIAIENAGVQLARGDWGIKLKPDDEKGEEDKGGEHADYDLLKKYADREREQATGSNPGSIFRVELDNTHPLAYGYGADYYTLKQDAVIYEYLKDGGWNVGVLRKNNYVSGFTGAKAREHLKDGLLFGVKEMGQGSIVLLADDPIFRSFWENGKLLFCNAVFMVGQ